MQWSPGSRSCAARSRVARSAGGPSSRVCRRWGSRPPAIAALLSSIPAAAAPARVGRAAVARAQSDPTTLLIASPETPPGLDTEYHSTRSSHETIPQVMDALVQFGKKEVDGIWYSDFANLEAGAGRVVGGVPGRQVGDVQAAPGRDEPLGQRADRRRRPLLLGPGLPAEVQPGLLLFLHEDDRSEFGRGGGQVHGPLRLQRALVDRRRHALEPLLDDPRLEDGPGERDRRRPLGQGLGRPERRRLRAVLRRDLAARAGGRLQGARGVLARSAEDQAGELPRGAELRQPLRPGPDRGGRRRRLAPAERADPAPG